MDNINSAIDFVMAIGPTVWKYVKYQIFHNHYMSEFEEMQGNLKHQQTVIDANLKTQHKQPGKIPNKEVEAWLEKACQETAEEVVEDLICRGGYFTNIRSSRKLDKKTQELNEIFMQGEKYTIDGVSLVVDDHSVEHCEREFKNKQKRLKDKKDDIEAILKIEREQLGKITRKEVEEWLEKAGQQIAMKVEDLINQEECSPSTNLGKKTEELKQTLDEGKEFTNAGVSLVIDDHSFKGVPLLVEECSGRDGIQEQILEWLQEDKVTRIAVWGMGGVGKTTIMKQVHNQLLKEPKFKKVIWVKVSKDFDIIVEEKKEFDIVKFQKRIASSLELELKPQEHDNEINLAGLISQKLGQGIYVLILDDVWVPFSLEDVGIPDLVGNNGCKLVLTTRVQDVARVMNFKLIQVNPLPADKALALFLEKVGSDVLSDGRIKKDIEPFLKQILQKCDGVPLVIVTMAKSMRGKPHPHSWKSALSEFSEFSESKGILDCLKFSYECMEPQCQECFLYCALYPEDYEIPKEELIEYWIEEGLMYKEGKTRKAMNWKGHDILDKLVENCLLQSVKKNYKEDCVSMHDLLREMALRISPQFLVKAGIALEILPEEQEWSGDLLKVSLMKNYIREIPSSMPSPKCPMLTTLLLSNNNISTISEAFFEHMLGLKILDLSHNTRLSRLPSSVSKLEKLTTLLLRGCVSLREVPFLSNFGDLKKLDLSKTSIEVPQDLNMLINLKYLCLGKLLSINRFGGRLWKKPEGFAGRLSEIPDGLLQTLCKLQHLEVDYCIPLKGGEIGRLGKLEYLKGRFSTVRDMGIFFNSGEKFLNMYSVFVGSYTEEMLIDVKLKFIVCYDIDICGEPNWLPSDVQRLEIKSCKDVRSLNDIPGFQDATDLHVVDIRSCHGMEFGISLSWLSRCNLSTFSSLKCINIFDCNKINKLFPAGCLQYLQNLETIRVESCEQMEEIIWSEYERGEQVTLPKLESLTLESLYELKSIYSGSNSVLICNSIKKIEIQNCWNIESVFWSGFNPLPTLENLSLTNVLNLESVFDEEALGLSPALPPTTPFSLQIIDIYQCSHLKKVFSSGWLLGYFQFLETISVDGCGQMEELISSSAYEEEKVTLPKLRKFSLIVLPQLKSIYSGSNTVLICDSIKSLNIIDCEKLKRIPLNFGFLDNAQSSHPPSLKQIWASPKEWWESLEWDHPNAKDTLLSCCKISH